MEGRSFSNDGELREIIDRIIEESDILACQALSKILENIRKENEVRETET